MEFLKTQKYKITLDNSGRPYHYSGFFLGESADGLFYIFSDEKIGKITFNKSRLTLVEEVEQ